MSWGSSMRIAFNFRHIDSSEAVKQYATDKLSKVQKYLRAPLDADVTVSTERHLQKIEVRIRCDGHTYVAHEESEDMYASIDMVANTLDRQVRRLKDTVNQKRRSGTGLPNQD
jgi:putative sigma-54 modulation protein